MRSKRERARSREQALDVSFPMGDEADIEREVSQSLLRDTVRAALQELPINQRQAINASHHRRQGL